MQAECRAPEISKTDELRQAGLASFTVGDYSSASCYFEEYLQESGSSDLVARSENVREGIFSAHSADEDIRSYIDGRIQNYADRTLRPRFFTDRSSRKIADVAGRKILLCFSRYTCNDARFMQNDMTGHFYDTAVRAGLAADVFFVDECSYPGLAATPLEIAQARLKELKSYVERTKPEVIFFDAQYIGDERTLTVEFINELREKFGVRTIGAMCDAWQDVCVPMANYWLPALDAMYHFAPGSPMEAMSDAPEKLVWSGFPVNRSQFHCQSERDIGISFAGTYDFGLRAYWLSVIALSARRHGFAAPVLQAHDRQVGSALSIEDYAMTMRRSEIVINLPRRYNDEFAVTGRIWQALHCGALLLEEYTPLTEAYFVPYVHYVPFRSAEELDRLLKFFKQNDSYIRRIGDQASRLMSSEYSENQIWSDILSPLN